MKILDTKMATGGQWVSVTQLREYQDEKLRFSLKSDAYRAQSHATVQIYNPGTRSWNHLTSIDPHLMTTTEGLAYLPRDRPATQHHFQADLAELERQVKLILD